ncbi:MAG TPA: class I SAM-dependent rRNA methyltransferase [Pseudomonadota bacterium]|nr:class I SAM-dependent rRNA methyltransferase [Pseudomonadota bacterium]
MPTPARPSQAQQQQVLATASRHGGLPRVTLSKNLQRSVLAGHPWLYREALEVPPGLRTGQVVDLVERSGRFLGRGLLDGESPIALRLYTLDSREPVDEALVARRLTAALKARRGAIELDRTDAFRLCHGEGDFLPGVVIDRYGPVAVVLFDGAAARALLPGVVAAVKGLGGPLAITALYERNQRRQGGGGQLLYGELPAAELLVREHGMRFLVDIVQGQKTGLFLDQRENRQLIRRYARGLTVWNGFAYTGGFSLAAALGGASRVVTVDSAGPAIAAAQKNFALNQLDPAAHEFYADDVFVHLQQAAQRQKTYDLVIVDPPSFAPTHKALPTALGAYRELHRLALAAVAPGGLLAAASCSSHVPEAEFLATLTDAAQHARRRLRVLEIHGQPADHPTLPAFPEGRYLKFILARID